MAYDIGGAGASRQPGRSGGDGTEDLDDLLADPHCRYLLAYLRQVEGPVEVSTLATQVVMGITDKSAEEVPPDVRRRVQTFLHHGQLPALAEHDVVDFDAEAGTVALEDEAKV